MATLADIEARGSLTPRRSTGKETVDDDGEDFTERLAGLYDEFTRLSDEAEVIRAQVDRAVQGVLGG